MSGYLADQQVDWIRRHRPTAATALLRPLARVGLLARRFFAPSHRSDQPSEDTANASACEHPSSKDYALHRNRYVTPGNQYRLSSTLQNNLMSRARW
jgi:hypothetical protein